jgi:DNA helicase-2/ATP-dependent DNA helicase PcrA
MDQILAAADPFSVLRGFEPPAPTRFCWPDFAEMMDRLRSSGSGWPAELSLVRTWYAPILEAEFDDADVRLADIDQLEQIAGSYPSRQKFLSDLTLDPADASTDQAMGTFLDEDYVILSTVHSAKGLEFSRVFVLNCVDGAFPSDLAVGEREDIEEERRLLYVAMTRAKNSLDLMQPRNFYVHGQQAQGDRHVLAARTRFIPNTILEHFERTIWPAATPDKPVTPGLERNVDLMATMRGMWSTAKA